MIRFLIETIKIKWATRKANILHNLTHRQYYVLKMQGRLKVYSAVQIRDMKKRRLLTKNFNWLKLQELAIYKTA